MNWLARRTGTAALFLAALILFMPPNVRAAPRGFDAVSGAAINYTGRDLNGVLFRNPDVTNGVSAVGPTLPYGGGGGMCCFALPHTWRPGIKVTVRYDWWQGPDVPRDFKYTTIELPPYPTDEPGTLWALFYEDGTMEVFASAVDPGHPKWPGKINHWPIPSRDYKLKLWQVEIDELNDLIKYAKRQLKGLSEQERSELWETRKKYWAKSIAGFDGPNDPKFVDFLRADAKNDVDRYGDRLRLLEQGKP